MHEGKAEVLVVDDDPDARALARGALLHEGHAVVEAADGEAALEAIAAGGVDLVVLDLGLPHRNGLDVLTEVRRRGDLPVIVLTGRAEESDRVVALRLGADDYLVKPFGFAELAARVRALLRRDHERSSGVVQVGALSLDAGRFEAHRHGRALSLSPKEFALLRYFLLHPGQVLTPERLLEHVWDGDVDPFSNTVRVTVSNLRRKLAGAAPDQPQPIETVIGRGYRLAESG